MHLTPSRNWWNLNSQAFTACLCLYFIDIYLYTHTHTYVYVHVLGNERLSLIKCDGLRKNLSWGFSQHWGSSTGCYLWPVIMTVWTNIMVTILHFWYLVMIILYFNYCHFCLVEHQQMMKQQEIKWSSFRYVWTKTLKFTIKILRNFQERWGIHPISTQEDFKMMTLGIN